VVDLTPPDLRAITLSAAAKHEVGRPVPPAKAFQVNEKDQAWVDAKLTPQPTAVSLQPIVLTGARDKIAKRTYIRATASPSPLFDGYFEKLKSDPGWHTYAVPSGHDVMVDMQARTFSDLPGPGLGSHQMRPSLPTRRLFPREHCVVSPQCIRPRPFDLPASLVVKIRQVPYGNADRSTGAQTTTMPVGQASVESIYAVCSVVGSIIFRTSVTLLAGNPLISACFRMISSSLAR
jgi:hypothetical protein